MEARDGGSLKCTACGLVFDPSRSPKQKRSKLELNAPAGFEATLTRAGMSTSYRDGPGGDAELVIVRRWSRTPGFQSVMLLVWIFVAVVMPLVGLPDRAPAVLYGVIVLIAGVVGYGIIAARLNTTRITVASGTLAIAHRPLPWFGGVTVDAASIMQIYCLDHASRLDPDREIYRVFAIVRGNRKPTLLVDELELATHALFLEHAIERALGIEDRPVDGDVERPRQREAGARAGSGPALHGERSGRAPASGLCLARAAAGGDRAGPRGRRNLRRPSGHRLVSSRAGSQRAHEKILGRARHNR
jgi:hypothetical protein